MPFDNKEFIDFMAKNATGAGIAGIGGFAHYLYKVSKGEAFNITRLVINIILAGWIGYICQELELASVWISIAGFCAYPLLNLIETRGTKILADLLLKKE